MNAQTAGGGVQVSREDVGTSAPDTSEPRPPADSDQVDGTGAPVPSTAPRKKEPT